MSWIELNVRLRKTRTEKEVLALFEEEKAGLRRSKWLKRIWSRYARLRRQRERKELEQKGNLA